MCFEDSSGWISVSGLFSGGRLDLERIVLRPFGLKCTPQEPAPHNHVGPTDAAKGHSCHGGRANIAENESLGNHFNALRRKGANVTENALWKVHDHWSQLHKPNNCETTAQKQNAQSSH